MDSHPDLKPSEALWHYWQIRKAIDIAPAVNLLVRKNVDRIDAEDAVRGLLQLIVSHRFSSNPTVPYIMLTGKINMLYESLRMEGGTFLASLEKHLKLKWGHLTLDGVSSPKVQTSEGIEYMIRQLQNDYDTYLTRSLVDWVFNGTRSNLMPTALFWSVNGDEALTQTLRLCNGNKISNCWQLAR